MKSAMQSRNLLASLATEREEGGAEKGEEAGGGLGDVVMADELDPVDGGGIGCSGGVVGTDIEDGGGEPGVDHIVTGGVDLAVEVGVRPFLKNICAYGECVLQTDFRRSG